MHLGINIYLKSTQELSKKLGIERLQGEGVLERKNTRDRRILAFTRISFYFLFFLALFTLNLNIELSMAPMRG